MYYFDYTLRKTYANLVQGLQGDFLHLDACARVRTKGQRHLAGVVCVKAMEEKERKSGVTVPYSVR